MGRRITVIFVLFFIILTAWGGFAVSVQADNTMLMFVGEDLDVLSIASGKEEAAWSAPAIANVVRKSDMENKNAATIAQSLESMPGFHINPGDKSSRIYLRGIPDSVLLLFDTVPMGSGVIKSSRPIDFETSMAPVKRIEVVRGTGSVLWGPDAFAGVVNVVPLSGKDFQGIKTGLDLSSGDTSTGEAWLNMGHKEKLWSGFLSVSGRREQDDTSGINVVKFWNDGRTAEPVDTRYGDGELDDSQYYNLYGSLSYGEWLTLSLKVSDNKKAYAVSDWDKEYEWEEIQEIRSSVLKLEATREIDSESGLRFTGYLTGISQDHTIIDRVLDQDESSWFGEVIYDRSFFLSKGLLTLGASWRHDQYENIPVWKAFYPSYLTTDNPSLLPGVHQVDFENSLGSVFGQYRHEFNDIEIWIGLRYDDHQSYEDKTSYNAGLAWNLSPFMVKTVYGTGYRTPFDSQLFDADQGNNLEKITSLNAQLSWKNRGARAALTLFRNEIENHVVEDNYSGYGLSSPNSQSIYGIELELEYQLIDSLKVSASLTLLDNSGDNEASYSPDWRLDDTGYPELGYLEQDHSYETGPDTLLSLKATWDLTEKMRLVPELRDFSKETLYYPVDDISLACDDAWIMDLNLSVRQVFPFDLTLYVNNLFDENYTTPGVYSATNGNGVSAGIILRMNW